jgi:serine/threonine-protein kinase HipA
MNVCYVCGTAAPTGARYHPACLTTVFGVPQLPTVDVDLARLHTLALAMVGRISVSGAQRKLSAHLDTTRATLQIAVAGGRYLLKPQAGTFPNLPENEWVTQRLAALAGMDVPPSALLELRDGTLAYVVVRFDRTEDGRKLAMEDFCQLSELPPAGKYDGSAERCGKIVQRFASEPLIESLRLYRQMVFTWWVGNGDLHLKNLALLRGDDGHWSLSPAYDQLNTRLVLPDDALAMPVCGKRDTCSASTWKLLAQRFGLGDKAAARVREEIAACLPDAVQLVEASPLPEMMREAYVELLRTRRPR